VSPESENAEEKETDIEPAIEPPKKKVARAKKVSMHSKRKQLIKNRIYDPRALELKSLNRHFRKNNN